MVGDFFTASSLLLISTTLLFIFFLAKLIRRRNKVVIRRSTYKLPPGRRGWPIVGDSFSWYNAVASSHPPHFVEQQVKRYALLLQSAIWNVWLYIINASFVFNFEQVWQDILMQSIWKMVCGIGRPNL